MLMITIYNLQYLRCGDTTQVSLIVETSGTLVRFNQGGML